MSKAINQEIICLEEEMREKILKIKELYSLKINNLKQKHKIIVKQEFDDELQQLTEIDIKTEFNDWWNLWLKLHDKVYKKDDKYYYVDTELNKIKEIEIINNFKEGNINNIVYLENIRYGRDNKCIYCYINTETHIKYIYINKIWEIYNI